MSCGCGCGCGGGEWRGPGGWRLERGRPSFGFRGILMRQEAIAEVLAHDVVGIYTIGTSDVGGRHGRGCGLWWC
jgi:hypothetical protein